MKPDDIRHIVGQIDNALSRLQDCLIDETNIHRVYLARKRLNAVRCDKEENNPYVIAEMCLKEFKL